MQMGIFMKHGKLISKFKEQQQKNSQGLSKIIVIMTVLY